MLSHCGHLHAVMLCNLLYLLDLARSWTDRQMTALLSRDVMVWVGHCGAEVQLLLDLSATRCRDQSAQSPAVLLSTVVDPPALVAERRIRARSLVHRCAPQPVLLHGKLAVTSAGWSPLSPAGCRLMASARSVSYHWPRRMTVRCWPDRMFGPPGFGLDPVDALPLLAARPLDSRGTTSRFDLRSPCRLLRSLFNLLLCPDPAPSRAG
jgi:hypothetical protein